MEMFYLIVFIVLGLVMGSFLHVVGVRLPKGESFANDRSGCPNCGHQLSWYELIPVLSYAMQGGKCRGCKQPISLRYPAAELATGALYGLSYWTFGQTPELLVSLLFVSMMVILFVSDILYMLIPDKVLLFFAPLILIALFFTENFTVMQAIYGMLLGGGIIAVLVFIGGMGAGDMKLFMVIGMMFGPSLTLFTFGFSCIVGGVIAGMLFFAGKVKRGEPFPFGPYIIVVAIAAFFWGDIFTEWYFSLY